MTGRHHHISEIVLKGIINNIDYVVSLQKDAKNFIKDIYMDGARYWGVFISINDIDDNELGYVAEIMPNNYIYQLKNVAFFLWLLICHHFIFTYIHTLNIFFTTLIYICIFN